MFKPPRRHAILAAIALAVGAPSVFAQASWPNKPTGLPRHWSTSGSALVTGSASSCR